MPFRDAVGHRRILELLARSVARNALPPSLIFSGPSGTGKRLTATALAQALNCQRPQSQQTAQAPETPLPVDACGTCPACARIARGVHPDVLVVEPGDNGSIKIEQIREVIESAAYRPFEGTRRVVIVDDADALVPAAQNALLKTLEEPPPSSVFVLVTCRPDMLLPTVRSRCIRLSFAEGARHEIDAEARDVAQTVLAHAASTPDPRRRIEAAKALLANTGSGGAADREQLAGHLRAMAALVRDVELLAARADAARLANPDMKPAIASLAKTYEGTRGLRAFGAIDRALVALNRNAGVKAVADWLVLEL